MYILLLTNGTPIHLILKIKGKKVKEEKFQAEAELFKCGKEDAKPQWAIRTPSFAPASAPGGSRHLVATLRAAG